MFGFYANGLIGRAADKTPQGMNTIYIPEDMPSEVLEFLSNGACASETKGIWGNLLKNGLEEVKVDDIIYQNKDEWIIFGRTNPNICGNHFRQTNEGKIL